MRVVISYAHDAEGKRLAQALVNGLPRRGVEVVWDRDWPLDNPVSMPEWISRYMTEYPVLTVLSPDYVHRFGNGDGTPVRRGVLFESRILQRRIFDHTWPDGCPIIPVADLTFSADLAPAALKNLIIARFEPESGDGLDQIVRRLLALDRQGWRPSTPSSALFDGVNSLISRLEAAAPSSADSALVRDWLLSARQRKPGCTEVGRAFRASERIIKSAGDADLMGDLVDCCLGCLPVGRLSAEETAVKALVLLHGQAWRLYRQHELAAAVVVAEEGVELSIRCDDRRLGAFGLRQLAILRCAQAKDSPPEQGDRRHRYLARALDHASQARALFDTIRDDVEYGACTKVLAQIHFARYRLDGQRSALRDADRLADQAVGYLDGDQDRTRDYHDLSILRALIAVARRDWPKATELLEKVSADLGRRTGDGASYTELVGWAHLAAARLRWGEGGWDAVASAAWEANRALDIFTQLDLPYAVAESRWLLASLVPATAGVRRDDVKTCERLFADPRERLRAVEERRRRIGERAGGRWVRRRSEWREIQRKLRCHP